MKLPLLFFFLASSAFAAEPQAIPLWPGLPPGSQPAAYPESETVLPKDGSHRVTNVTRPTLQIFLPPRGHNSGTAIVVCPGGGFRWLSIDHEGIEVAHWLNSLGVAAFVLKYRLIQTGDPAEDEPEVSAARIQRIKPLAAADGLQALRLVRAHAAEWNIDPHRIGILGFSAGGFVAAAAALQFDVDSRPDFAAPIYPATPENVTPPVNAPPLFLVQADDDKSVPTVGNSVRLYEAWHRAGIPAEIHVYARGGHGFGMRKNSLPVGTWTDRLRDWLDSLGLLQPSA